MITERKNVVFLIVIRKIKKNNVLRHIIILNNKTDFNFNVKVSLNVHLISMMF